MRQRNTRVAINTADLKRAFRGAFPNQTSAELKQPWERLWAAVILHGDITKPVKLPGEVPVAADVPVAAEEPTE